MWPLVWKDLYCNRVYLFCILVVIALVYLLAFALGNAAIAGLTLTFLGTYALLFAPFLALGIVAREEKHRTLGFLKTLPLPVRDIVAAPFFTVLACSIVIASLFSLLALLTPGINDASSSLRWGYLPSYFLIMACTLPITGLGLAVFYWKDQKTAQFTVVGAGSLMLFGFAVYTVSHALNPEVVYNWLYHPPIPAAVCLSLFCLVIYWCEYLLAARFFERREL